MNLSELTLSQLVSRNFRTAAVFEKYNLDFCCRGNRSVTAACAEKGINPDEVLTELLSSETEQTHSNFSPETWSADFLIDYIINTHHSYLRKMIPVISAHAAKVASVHGTNHTETKDINRIFTAVYKDLKQHMMKEEEILFPHVKRLVKIKESGAKYEKPYFGSVRNPVRMMEAEHQNAGDELYEIRELTGNYNPPEDACNTYKILYSELRDFEEDLHRHVHLENNILFPAAVKLESELSAV